MEGRWLVVFHRHFLHNKWGFHPLRTCNCQMFPYLCFSSLMIKKKHLVSSDRGAAHSENVNNKPRAAAQQLEDTSFGDRVSNGCRLSGR